MFSKKVLSIDIGNKNIKLVVGRQQGNNVLVERAITLPTPEDSYNDGKILDVEALKRLILNILENERIKVKKAICTVNSTSIITREIALPYTKNDDEIDNMIRLELEQYLPVMLNDYVIEYKLLEGFIEDGVNKSRFIVVALPKIIVEGYLELIKKLKMTPVALDINPNAVSKLFTYKVKINNENYSLDETVAFIDMGYNYTSLNIVTKGISQFFRTLNLGGKDIDVNIANHFDLSLEDAETKKEEVSNLSDSNNMIKSSELLNDIVKNSIDSWLQELERLFRYYITRSSGNKIDQIYIYGGSSKINAVTEYIRERLNIPTNNIKNISNIRAAKQIDDLDLTFYLNAIGSVIRR